MGWPPPRRRPRPAALWWRMLHLKARFESGPSYLSFKSTDPGAFNAGFIGSTCTALPRARQLVVHKLRQVTPQRDLVRRQELLAALRVERLERHAFGV